MTARPPLPDDEISLQFAPIAYKPPCWAGIFMCWTSREANIVNITKGYARSLGREHEDYINLPEVQVRAGL
jgi:hypothetical protein